MSSSPVEGMPGGAVSPTTAASTSTSMLHWPRLNLRDCLVDPPSLRKGIEDAETAVSRYESLLRSLVKVSKSSLEAARNSNEKQRQFTEELIRVSRIVSDGEPEFDSFLSRLDDELTMYREMHDQFISLTQHVFIEAVEDFLATHIVTLKDAKKKFESASDSLDSALDKYLGKKHGDSSIPESARDVADARRSFHEASLNYCARLNAVQVVRKVELMTRLYEWLGITNSFNSQTHNLMRQLMNPRVATFTAAANKLRDETSREAAAMDRLKTRLVEAYANTYNPMNKGIFDTIKAATLSTAAASSANATPSGSPSIRPASSPIPSSPLPSSGPIGSSNADPAGEWTVVDAEPVLKAGYLLKKNQAQRMRVSWSRRYFVIRGELLVYQQRDKDTEPVVAVNLRLSTVKPCDPTTERRFAFQIISNSKTYILQAENEEDMNSWIDSLQKAIGGALQSSNPPSSHGLGKSGSKKETLSSDVSPAILEANRAMEEQKNIVSRIRGVSGNNVCCDCGHEDPEWASINLGVVLCIECSGIHRSFGTAVSKVRSLILDKWDADMVECMCKLGNNKVNAVYLRLLPDNVKAPGMASSADRATREAWIKRKYVAKEFVSRDGVLATLAGATSAVESNGPPSSHEAFWDAIRAGDLSRALALYTVGASIDWQHPTHGYRTALHEAVRNGDSVACEFLLQWGCNVNIQDKENWTPLHYAADTRNNQMAHRLVRRCGAQWDLKDTRGRTPLDIATVKEDPLITTMLRLVALDPNAAGSRFGISEALSDTNAKGPNSATSPGVQRKPVPGSTSLAPSSSGLSATTVEIPSSSAMWSSGAHSDPIFASAAGRDTGSPHSVSGNSGGFFAAPVSGLDDGGFGSLPPTSTASGPPATSASTGSTPGYGTGSMASSRVADGLEENPWG
ncbi:hypothetical protein BCR44DRAFT_33472 [Catenaria anguillulae PL171]|uniref:Uncharacterized protein n=1 Tax=Catenaria anguillulae PL171 TaxID=765915 RepID=A0A1Y2HAS4_9FUNG|nr:hypothetical protein BCR44DRAFT_33472 [Catenaria anguillulae PL171]